MRSRRSDFTKPRKESACKTKRCNDATKTHHGACGNAATLKVAPSLGGRTSGPPSIRRCVCRNLLGMVAEVRAVDRTAPHAHTTDRAQRTRMANVRGMGGEGRVVLGGETRRAMCPHHPAPGQSAGEIRPDKQPHIAPTRTARIASHHRAAAAAECPPSRPRHTPRAPAVLVVWSRGQRVRRQQLPGT